jgi:hypothetical protein
MVTGVASITDEWALLGLGFRLLQRNLGRRRESGPSAYPRRRYSFYKRRGVAASILGVDEAAANRAPSSAPPSCLLTRGWRRPFSETVSWAGMAPGPAR